MPVEAENNQDFSQYAHPERLVSTQWVADNAGKPGVVVVESDEDVLLYETGHIPGSVKVDWHTDLNEPDTRDYVNGEQFAELMSRKGISRDDTIVVYGDKSNWWAAYALWVFTLFGHEDVRLMNGGRDKWVAEGRELTTDATEVTPTDYPVVERDDSVIRAYREDVLENLGTTPLIDVRSPQEYTGERTHMPDYPQEAHCAAVTSPPRHRFPGLAQPRRIPPSSPVTSWTRSTARKWACQTVTTLSPTAASASVPPTRVRAHPLAGLRQGPQLRRFLDRVGNAVRVPVAQGEARGEAPEGAR